MRRWKFFGLIMLLMSMITSTMMAQGVSISGTVLSDDGAPLAGVTVTVVGANRSVVTADNGKFTVNADAGVLLEFSYVGYTTQSVKAAAGMVVRLAKSTEQLGEVVVTALGIKKERKALGYAVTELSASELMKNKSTNIINSLAGKAPGVNITQFSGAAGAGASITIRGGNSTSEGRQNQPLFVVDGIIYDNSTSVSGNTGTDGMSRSNTTYSNRVMDINPEDIETLSVLKGSAAAALYGSRAADGVVIITTKKGAEGTVKVTATSKITTSWANKLPEAQTTFKNGIYASNGVFNDITYSSWGPKLGASDTLYDNINDFFRNGIIYDNNVSVSGGSKNGSFYLSGSNFNQDGIVPNTGFRKTTFRFNGEQKYGRLTLSSNVAYSIANTDRTLTTSGLYSGGGNGTMGAIYGFPQNFNMKRYENIDGSQYRRFAGTVPLENDLDNPYWIINKDKLTSETKRFTGGINASYKIASWWDIITRLGYDQYNTNDYNYIAPGSAVIPLYQNGRLSKNLLGYTFTSTTVMSNFHKSFGDFDARVMIGNTTEATDIVSQNHWGFNFITAGTISFGNIATTNQFFKDGVTKKRLVGTYGEVGVSYKNIAFLTATGRNDWSSTLPLDSRSYFYPSVSGSVVITELLPKSSILSFGKVRGSWAQVGKDANPYATLTYVNNPITIGSYTGIGNQYTSGNPFLKPEIQNSWEVGGEFRFLGGRVGLDVTYYHSQTQNQIAQPRLSNASGYILTSINSGSVINKGVEIAVTGKPISRRDFTWDVAVNFSYNKGRLGDFLPGVAYFYPTDAQFGGVKAASIPNGGYFLGMTGTRFLREVDTKGVEVANGRYQVDPTTGLYKINTNNPIVGNREPSFIGGISNTVRYKKFMLSLLLDIRKGGDIYNGTEYAMVVNGLSKRTLLNDRQSVTVTGVNSVTGADFSQTYNAGQNYVINGATLSGNYLIQQYWSNYAANSENFITSVNWVKVRSLSLNYDFTSMLKNKRIIKELSATIVGTNLFTWTNYKGMDPEVSAAGGTGGSGSTGIDYLGVPAVAGVTFGVNITF
ncbi:SusC/RagA family TonB-linked outer membrane protein [Sediminibacterium ginsengisoli]|uniref:TonB-linked outer membrane protein, SusC/RagA family n=1 Tax=Sediminibacterium ginsengisoli TaxID=413434 RepID=A0A1T4Q329_9BACT|nr:SusC/RagA family TonB-linked outer membrane protein [Sediminibacterium ginsengisoli]SJZ98149.1 TonB-linked outer membrane protein, SusC/RagA family [Sediminibacterium ginsengisoli]